MPKEDIRSNKCVFVSHCILAQCIRANGLAKYYAGAVKPVVRFCLDHDINIMQMPCPESMCEAGGLGRDPHGKKWYEDRGLRQTAEKIARGQVIYMQELVKAGHEILAIIGMEFSPACAVTYLNKGPVIYKDEGIYVEELKKFMVQANLDIPFIGVNQRAHKKLDRQLNEMLRGTLGEYEKKEEEKKKKKKSNDGQLSLFD
ncbi:MAG: hypothetical protein AAF614_23930 [Chloroflexota bacterium]